MSKSKGNVIDPLELIGVIVDALRFTLLSMASPGRCEIIRTESKGL